MQVKQESLEKYPNHHACQDRLLLIMDKKSIASRARKMRDKADLLSLINILVKKELGEEHAFVFSESQLNYYCNPNNTRRYTNFPILKKSGGYRLISAPNKRLKHILYYVNTILKAMYQPSEYAMGFVEGRSVVDNARKHTRKNYVFNIDLENFFSSIEKARVWARLQLKPFFFPRKIADIIAGLCCIKITSDGVDRYVLPQGAPTSPLLTNAICDNLDKKLAKLARRYNLTYTRYADDITFSSPHNVYKNDGDFRKELSRIIDGQHFKINTNKTRLQKRDMRQEVTGLVVNDKVNITRHYVNELRNILYIWKKYGHDEASNRFNAYYKDRKGHVKKGVPLMENVISGKLQYLKMVKGDEDNVYITLQSCFDKLGDAQACGKRPEPQPHFPKKTADFLSLFNMPSELKYLTHRFDPDSGNTYEELMEHAKKVLDSSLKTNSIPKSLYALMTYMVLGEGEYWLDYTGTKQTENYTSGKWMNWSKENGGCHVLDNPDFAQYIQLFRKTIRIVKPALEDIVKEMEEKFPKMDIQRVKLGNADFYTNVFYLKKGIERILSDMDQHSDKTPHVHFEFDRSYEYEDVFCKRKIIITQERSEAGDINDAIKKFTKGGGSFAEIVKFFRGYCNWSVEALWNGEPKRWNILDDEDHPAIEDIDGAGIKGFTHILTYYSKI